MWGGDALRVRVALAVLVLTGVPGCVERAVFESLVPMDYAPVPTVPPPGPTEGAIWPGDTHAGSFLFFDEKARGPGDLITVVIDENLSASGEATTDLDRKSTLGATLSSDVGFQEWVRQGFETIFDVLGTDDPGRDVPKGDEVNIIEADTTNDFEGEGSTERRAGFSGVITCRVLNVLPGDVFHIRGKRMLHVNHEVQIVTVEGLVRAEDISINNTVPSAALAEARLTFDGIGVIDDRQRPGFVARAMGWLFPF